MSLQNFFHLRIGTSTYFRQYLVSSFDEKIVCRRRLTLRTHGHAIQGKESGFSRFLSNSLFSSKYPFPLVSVGEGVAFGMIERSWLRQVCRRSGIQVSVDVPQSLSLGVAEEYSGPPKHLFPLYNYSHRGGGRYAETELVEVLLVVGV